MLSTKNKRLLPVMATIAVLTAGCATDSVQTNRYDLQGLNEAVARQQSDITYIRLAGDSRHQELVDTSQHSTQQILDAITRQVQPPACPPVPETRACTATESQDLGSGERIDGKQVVGEVEKAYLVGPGFVYDARIDSGATTSSMDARNIRRFERDGNQWVRFDIPVPGTETGEVTTIEREIARNARIIQSNVDDPERRPVVELQFRIGSKQQKAEFTLSDRSHLTYPMLIGRNILRDVMLIDVGREYATELPRSLINGNQSRDD